MTRNKKRIPEFPEDYSGENALIYNAQKWMERNQKRSTLECIQYLSDPKLGSIDMNKSYVILDLGCGTGFSTEIIQEYKFKVIGVEILSDMIELALQRKREFKINMELILANINYLPIRKKAVDHILSVSAYNFIIHGKKTERGKKRTVNSTAKYLNKILRTKGRIIIEFYPRDDVERELFTSSFLNNGFEGFFIKNHPNQKSGQTFVLLKKIK